MIPLRVVRSQVFARKSKSTIDRLDYGCAVRKGRKSDQVIDGTLHGVIKSSVEFVEALMGREFNVPTHSEIERQVATQLEVVLQEAAEIVIVLINIVRKIHAPSSWIAEQQGGDSGPVVVGARCLGAGVLPGKVRVESEVAVRIAEDETRDCVKPHSLRAEVETVAAHRLAKRRRYFVRLVHQGLDRLVYGVSNYLVIPAHRNGRRPIPADGVDYSLTDGHGQAQVLIGQRLQASSHGAIRRRLVGAIV